MGTHINFQHLGTDPSSRGEVSNTITMPLSRQSSIYSLTFDEFQSTLGKDFGSMNMDELLKNIWSAEESQIVSSSAAAADTGQSGSSHGVNLERQGSLTLPRTFSQKTVDEVWSGLITKESTGGSSSAPTRQRSLAEMTLEEFLVRSGVVREDDYVIDNGFYPNSSVGLGPGFSQANNSNISFGGIKNRMSFHQPRLGLDLKMDGTGQQQQLEQQLQQTQTELLQPRTKLQPQTKLLQPRTKLQPQTLFPKQVNVSLAGVFGNSVNNGSSLAGVGTRVSVSATSPGTTSSADTDSLSPVPHVFGRGRRRSSVALEKVIERRQKRMIKNRESAARSRARKQAYTLELEAEAEKLKKLNQELQKKQAEMMEILKNEIKESLNRPWGGSMRRCLRRTLTGPW